MATQMILDVHLHNQEAIVSIWYRDKGVDRLDNLPDIDDEPQWYMFESLFCRCLVEGGNCYPLKIPYSKIGTEAHTSSKICQPRQSVTPCDDQMLGHHGMDRCQRRADGCGFGQLNREVKSEKWEKWKFHQLQLLT